MLVAVTEQRFILVEGGTFIASCMCTNAESDRPSSPSSDVHTNTHLHQPSPIFIHTLESDWLYSIILIKRLIFVLEPCRSKEAQQPLTFEDSYIFINC